MGFLAILFARVPYLFWNPMTLLQTLTAWLEEHPRQVLFWIVIVLLILGYLWWLQSSQRYRQTADQRAEQLLRESLSPEQYQQLEAQGFLEVPSKLTPWNFYRIPRHAGRVQVYETHSLNDQIFYRLKADLCVISSQSVPDADLVLAHKWMIEGDEQTYTVLANWYMRHNQIWMLYNASRLANPA